MVETGPLQHQTSDLEAKVAKQVPETFSDAKSAVLEAQNLTASSPNALKNIMENEKNWGINFLLPVN